MLLRSVKQIDSYTGWIKLLLFNIAEVIEKLFPSVAEEEGFVATTPDRSTIHFASMQRGISLTTVLGSC